VKIRRANIAVALQCAQLAVFALSLFWASQMPASPLAWIGLGLLQNVLWWTAFVASPIPHRAYSYLAASALLILTASGWTSPFETDFYRYEWDGRALLAGINPYANSPAALLASSGFAPDLAPKINFADLSTVYSPLALAGFALSALIGKLTALGFLGALRLLLWLSAWLALRPYPTAWLWLLHPLFLREGLSHAHYDVLLGAVLLALLPRLRGGAESLGATIGVAIAGFGAALIKLPGLLIATLTPRATLKQAALAGFAVTALVLAGLGLVHLLDPQVLGSSFHSLFRFSTEWEANSGWVRWVRNALLDWNWIAEFESASAVARLGVAGAGAALCASLWRSPLSSTQRGFWIFFLLAWLSPAANAWYFLWAMFLIPALTPTRLQWFACALLILLPLGDAHWLHHYAISPHSLPMWSWVRDRVGVASLWDFEHGAISAGLVLAFISFRLAPNHRAASRS